MGMNDANTKPQIPEFHRGRTGAGGERADELILNRLLELTPDELRNVLGIALEYSDHPEVTKPSQSNRLRRMIGLAYNELFNPDSD